MNNSLKEVLTWSLMCLIVLGFIGLVVFSTIQKFKNVKKFAGNVQGKLNSWDTFVTRTGLQWEMKQPGVPDVNDNPVMKHYFGEDVINRTGRVYGVYRNYQVLLCNQTRNRHVSGGHSMMVSGQDYYTDMRLTIQNHAGIRLLVQKANQLTIEPQQMGSQLLT